jgi:hypothetical protein
VISGLILALFLWLAGFLPAVWHALKSASIWLLHLLLLSVSVPFWLILLFSPFIIATLFRVFYAIKPKNLTWSDYKQDNIMGIKWHWQYGNYSGDIQNIYCLCPYDDTELVYIESLRQVSFRCETCNRKFGPFDGDHEHICRIAERQIRRKIRSGEWKAVIEQFKLQK